MNAGTGITDLSHNAARGSAGARDPAAGIMLPGTPESVPIARRLVQDALAGCPRVGDLVLTVSELATNAIMHSASRSGMFTVRVSTTLRWARVEVTDDGPAAGPSAASNGWGLAIVADVTDRSGSITQPDGRRKSWGEVTWCP